MATSFSAAAVSRGLAARLVTIAIATAAVGAHPDTVVLRDDFNRPNSPNVGGAWVEQNELTGIACCHNGIRIDPGYIDLSSNAMAFRATKLPDSAAPNANTRTYATRHSARPPARRRCRSRSLPATSGLGTSSA
jgi:hypothetical protein